MRWRIRSQLLLPLLLLLLGVLGLSMWMAFAAANPVSRKARLNRYLASCSAALGMAN